MNDQGMRDRQPPTSDLDARFDRELGRVARSLVTEELPRGVLDSGLAPVGGVGRVRARRPFPTYAGFVAVVVLLLATAIALVPGGGQRPSPTATPGASAAPSTKPSPSPGGTPVIPGTFRSTADIRADFERLRYLCKEGGTLLPTGPSPSAPAHEGAICTAPADAGPFIAAVVVAEAKDGRVVEVDVKADLTGEDTAAAREEIAVPLAKAVAIAASGQDTANALAAWVIDALPALKPSSGDSIELRGFDVKILRGSSGGYQLYMFQLPAAS